METVRSEHNGMLQKSVASALQEPRRGWAAFSDGLIFFFFYFGYPDLSLNTQTRFSNLTILNTHKQRTDKLCLVAVANEFVALNDNRKDNFATLKDSDLKMSW